jgi:hypothetical protein
MTFGKRPCTTFDDFLCCVAVFVPFFKTEVLSNCSADCPSECSTVDFTFMLTFAKFPPASYLYYLLAQSKTLGRKYFNLSQATFREAMATVRPELVPSMDEMQAKLSGKLVFLNVYYDELMFTKIEESAKLSLVDLIAGMGGMLVKFIFTF